MKKLAILTIAVMIGLGIATVATAEYSILPVAGPFATGAYVTVPTHLTTVGKVVAIEATGVVSNKTIILYRVDGTTTNTISTSTTAVVTGSREVFDLSSSGYFWLARGETWLRGGTETNAPIRLILDQ